MNPDQQPMTQRQQFEAWHKEEFGGTCGDNHLCSREWTVWQAAQSASSQKLCQFCGTNPEKASPQSCQLAASAQEVDALKAEVESFKQNNRYQRGYHDGEQSLKEKIASLEAELARVKEAYKVQIKGLQEAVPAQHQGERDAMWQVKIWELSKQNTVLRDALSHVIYTLERIHNTGPLFQAGIKAAKAALAASTPQANGED